MADAPAQSPLSNTTQGLITDIEKLLGQRLGRLKDEVVNELGKATTAGASFGGGLGMAALGTILGGIGFVHLAHKVTGLPLWLCYAGSSAAACAVGAGMLAEGAKKVGEMDVVPDGTGRALREAVAGNGR
ncbi:MAG: phage holin family protein [Planctomycetes bacterium]|nr:phage holin family protein [Planctomycetota bacterium]